MKKVLLAVSGGIDSMYMANRASDLFPGALAAVAHCNFTLRGEESDGDELFVRQWCAGHGMTCHVRRFDTALYASQKGISIEMAARELRYGWFARLCNEFGYEAVAVAHNANDDAETLMLNLLRGTGTKGIRGMGDRPGILRPLLGIERAEIQDWMTQRGLGWREDSSNAGCDVKRNIIRNEVFPVFRRINPSFIKTLREDMRRFAQVDDIAEDYFLSVRDSLLTGTGDIRLDMLLGLRHREYLLWRLLEGSGIRREEFNSLVACLREGRQYAGKTFGPVIASAGRLTLRGASKACGRQLVCETLSRDELDSLVQEDGVIILDAGKLPLPLKIRRWRSGDWMTPLGMKGRKKLSDILTELKYNLDEKQEAEVIELEGSHVAALLCRKIDESVKVDGRTASVLRLSYRSSSM